MVWTRVASAGTRPLQLRYDVPIDKERGLPLLDIRAPKRSLDEVILPPSSSAALEEILEENRRGDVLRSYGMKPAGKVIFFGPPGCGKTLAAEVVAFGRVRSAFGDCSIGCIGLILPG